MSNVNLARLLRPGAASPVDSSQRISERADASAVYSDLKLDLAAAPPSQMSLNARRSVYDLALATDEESVLTALHNIMTTRVLMRPLRPDIDADVTGFLFEPLTESKAFFMVQRLAKAIPVYEPRVRVDSATVTVNVADKCYLVALKVSIPSIGRSLTVSHSYGVEGAA